MLKPSLRRSFSRTPSPPLDVPEGVWIHRRHDAHVVHLDLGGEIDLASRRPIMDRAEAAPGATVQIDMSAVSFVDSAGIETLLRIQRRQRETGGDMHVVRASDRVLRTFELAGLLDRLVGDVVPGHEAIDG